LYTWNLTASGWANQYYAAAAWAGSRNWTALLFGSLDAGNAITVDKPPASLWLMALSGRIFGFSSWSMLIPQAVLGVATVALLYAAVRRWSGHRTGLLAGALFALTPVVTLMFRFNNPDALLTMLLVAAGYALVRALEKASAWWLALVGVAIGFAFLTKMLQAFVILPVLALVYLVAAPTSLPRRLRDLLIAGGALLVSALWWVGLVALTPASSRPYIGGTSDNNIWTLIISGNGLDRLLGNAARSAGAPGGGGAGPTGTSTAFGGPAGWDRMFGDSFGTQVSWLLPAALIGLVAAVWLRGRTPRTDRIRAALLLWGGWTMITAAVFSFMGGVVHPYYGIALAPGIAAVVAVSVRELWRAREQWPSRAVLAAMVAVTGGWGWVLLGRAESWHPELRWIVAVAAVLGAAGFLAMTTGTMATRRMTLAVAGMAAVTAVLPSAAYSLQTVSTGHSGSIPTAGPDGTGELDGGTSGAGPGSGTPGPAGPGMGEANQGNDYAFPDESAFPGGYAPPGGPSRGSPPDRPGVGADVDTEIVALLERTDTTWAAAVIGSHSAAPLELSSDRSVIAIGGFSGGDDGPSLATFRQWVAEGKVSYFLLNGSGEGPVGSGVARGDNLDEGPGGVPGQGRGRTSPASEITTWVTENNTATTVGSWTVYDLTSATAP
jgi:4-amino-4-deoxy-L-arabinose transferase-like glycosyltransferase